MQEATPSNSKTGRHQPVSETTLEVIVLFTSEHSALRALRTAATLAKGLAARIRLLVLHVVPYALPLDRPAVDLDFLSQRLSAITSQAGVDSEIEIHVCRDRTIAMRQALPQPAIAVIGQQPRWWNFREQRLAKELRQMGHQLVFAVPESSHA